MRSWSLLAILTTTLPAQELFVRSEFQRAGADGKVIAQDHVDRPREILSPALARNGFASFLLTATIPANVDYSLEIGQNPENTARVVLYQQAYNPNGIPDRLEKVSLPIQGKTSREEVLTYWLDLYVANDAPVRRFKIEAQLWVGDRWIIYPMEARIVAAQIPAFQHKFWGLPAPESRADAAMISPWRDHLCRPLKNEFQPKETTIRLLQQRNVQQDVALAKKLGRDIGIQAFVRGGILPELAVPDRWCASPVEAWRDDLGAEWYLRVRDHLYRQ
ncbi:MAG TPA: hypothetical protein VFQ91_12550 [Bryobacteraceae bacterium]|nr:hypothetical protein [Bryobacteraceae bacterium]